MCPLQQRGTSVSTCLNPKKKAVGHGEHRGTDRRRSGPQLSPGPWPGPQAIVHHQHSVALDEATLTVGGRNGGGHSCPQPARPIAHHGHRASHSAGRKWGGEGEIVRGAGLSSLIHVPGQGTALPQGPPAQSAPTSHTQQGHRSLHQINKGGS